MRDDMQTMPKYKSVYLLPNLLTSLCLFSGFYSIISSIKGNYTLAAEAILLAAVFDGLDGRIARLTKTTSRFGVEYDSLSDLISFGVAPGILGFLWGLQGYGRLGWLAAFLYVATTALRLARFNTLSMAGSSSKAYFLGLPCPSAAAMVATSVLFCNYLGMQEQIHSPWILGMMYGVAFLMVSNIHYYSFKEMPWLRQHPFSGLIIILLLLSVTAIEYKITLFAIFLTYILSGPILFPFKFLKKKTPEDITHTTEVQS
jgi:CDP-diacylglycerol--serine O-phosphatidyltransferase